MCELLGLCSDRPFAATATLRHFAARSGVEGRTLDGWGVALFQGETVRSYREPEPAHASALLESICARGVASPLMMAHIRHATRGAIALANTQPFVREIGGRPHCFAHNGHLGSIDRHMRELITYRPAGETDSEIAACVLFERMTQLWRRGEDTPALANRLEVLEQFAAEMRALGTANFLYSDGLALFAHAHCRRQSDSETAMPGLWRSRVVCSPAPLPGEAGLVLRAPTATRPATLFASVPLGGGRWDPMPEGALLVAPRAVTGHPFADTRSPGWCESPD